MFNQVILNKVFQEATEPSKAEKFYEILGMIATGMSGFMHIPIYLSWGIIIWVLLTLIYIGLITVESFIRIFRWLVIIGWALIGMAMFVVIQIIT